MQPWSTVQIDCARQVPISAALNFLGAYIRRDRNYLAPDPKRKSVRIHVNHEGRVFRFLLADEKWVKDPLPSDHLNCGGGCAIDFARYLTGLGFGHAVMICLDAAKEVNSK